jgi:hypothetical protein
MDFMVSPYSLSSSPFIWRKGATDSFLSLKIHLLNSRVISLTRHSRNQTGYCGVVVGVQAGGIRIIRLGGIIVF